MHYLNCTCPKCQISDELEWGEWEFQNAEETYGETGLESPFSEIEEIELAAELLSISSEEELDQFLGKLFKGAWKGIKKVGSVVGKIAKPLGGVLKGVAKAALPFVGGALGSFIPVPGVGTALGTALGGALSKALELEFGDLEQEEQEFEIARHFVRIAGTAARQATLSDPNVDSQMAAKDAVMSAAQQHVSNLPSSVTGTLTTDSAMGYAPTGRWDRYGRVIRNDRNTDPMRYELNIKAEPFEAYFAPNEEAFGGEPYSNTANFTARVADRFDEIDPYQWPQGTSFNPPPQTIPSGPYKTGSGYCTDIEQDLYDLVGSIGSFNRSVEDICKLMKQKPRDQVSIDATVKKAKREKTKLRIYLERMRDRIKNGHYFVGVNCTIEDMYKDIAKVTCKLRKYRSGAWLGSDCAGKHLISSECMKLLDIASTRELYCQLVYWLRHTRGRTV